jgi:putative membrane protein insertion efficiency factor
MSHFAKFVTLQLLRAYKWAISPLLPPACRYVPTCSEYAMEAVERYGVLRGGWMALIRVLRCHPLGSSGYDPVVKQTNFATCSVELILGGAALQGCDKAP